MYLCPYSSATVSWQISLCGGWWLGTEQLCLHNRDKVLESGTLPSLPAQVCWQDELISWQPMSPYHLPPATITYLNLRQTRKLSPWYPCDSNRRPCGCLIKLYINLVWLLVFKHSNWSHFSFCVDNNTWKCESKNGGERQPSIISLPLSRIIVNAKYRI